MGARNTNKGDAQKRDQPRLDARVTQQHPIKRAVGSEQPPRPRGYPAAQDGTCTRDAGAPMHYVRAVHPYELSEKRIRAGGAAGWET